MGDGSTAHDWAVAEGWLQRMLGEIGPGGFPLNAPSRGLVASLVVKSGAGTLFGMTGLNTNAGAQFVQLFDATTLPANAAIPFVVFTVTGSSNFAIDFGIWGRAFTQGIVVCNSSTAATKTIGAADCWFDAQYA